MCITVETAKFTDANKQKLFPRNNPFRAENIYIYIIQIGANARVAKCMCLMSRCKAAICISFFDGSHPFPINTDDLLTHGAATKRYVVVRHTGF